MIPADVELQLDDADAMLRASYELLRAHLRHDRPGSADRLLDQMADDHVRRLRDAVRATCLITDALRKDAAKKPVGLTVLNGGKT